MLLTGGYVATNPNVFNGFERKLSGMWNVGVMVRVPLWNWMEGTYKVRASRIATTIVELERDDIREKIDLQVSPKPIQGERSQPPSGYGNKERGERRGKPALRQTSDFKEGVIPTTDVMAAQTAWVQAQSQKIDAEVDVKMSQVNLKKATRCLAITTHIIYYYVRKIAT